MPSRQDACTVNAHQLWRATHSLAWIVLAEVVRAGVALRAVAVVQAGLHAVSHDAPLAGWTIGAGAATLSLADSHHAELVRRTVSGAGARIERALASLAVVTRRALHVTARIPINASAADATIVLPGAVTIGVAARYEHAQAIVAAPESLRTGTTRYAADGIWPALHVGAIGLARYAPAVRAYFADSAIEITETLPYLLAAVVYASKSWRAVTIAVALGLEPAITVYASEVRWAIRVGPAFRPDTTAVDAKLASGTITVGKALELNASVAVADLPVRAIPVVEAFRLAACAFEATPARRAVPVRLTIQRFDALAVRANQRVRAIGVGVALRAVYARTVDAFVVCRAIGVCGALGAELAHAANAGIPGRTVAVGKALRAYALRVVGPRACNSRRTSRLAAAEATLRGRNGEALTVDATRPLAAIAIGVALRCGHALSVDAPLPGGAVGVRGALCHPGAGAVFATVTRGAIGVDTALRLLYAPAVVTVVAGRARGVGAGVVRAQVFHAYEPVGAIAIAETCLHAEILEAPLARRAIRRRVALLALARPTHTELPWRTVGVVLAAFQYALSAFAPLARGAIDVLAGIVPDATAFLTPVGRTRAIDVGRAFRAVHTPAVHAHVQVGTITV